MNDSAETSDVDTHDDEAAIYFGAEPEITIDEVDEIDIKQATYFDVAVIQVFIVVQ